MSHAAWWRVKAGLLGLLGKGMENRGERHLEVDGGVTHAQVQEKGGRLGTVMELHAGRAKGFT